MNEIEQLINIALENKKNSYSPYSHFRVSCAVKTKTSAAISEGEIEFAYIVINGDSHDTFPCGVCRQFIREFADKDTQIVIANAVDDYKIFTIDELLPYSFSNEDLKEI